MKDYLSKPEINFLLSILIPLVALAAAWGTMATRMDNIEKNMVIIQAQYTEQVKVNEIIKVSLARIETDIIYI
jgi:hypothetical protein